MAITILFTLLGYFSGSVLYANLFGMIFGKKDLYQNSADRNPGTSNAFRYGGFWCGTLTLICELMKSFWPVFLYMRVVSAQNEWGIVPVLAAPVIGHIFPIFCKFRGGKGIAATFGCLLGCVPYGVPLLVFAAAFLFFSLVLRISPNYYRTIAAYPSAAAGMILCGVPPAIWSGFFIIAGAVCFRLCRSTEEKEKCEVKLLWMR